MNTSLNNAVAYRFLSIKLLPILEEIINNAGYKAVRKKQSNKITDVVFKFKDGDSVVETSPTIYYPDFDSVAVSLHKMMYCKHILFVKETIVYVIPQSAILSIWNNKEICKIDNKKYIDGIGEQSQMSRINVDWLMANAIYKLNMNNDLAEKYKIALNDII